MWKGGDHMDNYEYEEIVQEPRNLISDGATDEML